MSTLTAELNNMVQRAGSATNRLQTPRERTAFAANVRADLSQIISNHNSVLVPLLASLISEAGLEALNEGIAGDVILTHKSATAQSAAALWNATASRPRSIKETVDVLLSELSRIENSINSISSGGSAYDDTAVVSAINTNSLNLTQLKKDTVGENYSFDADGNADNTYPLAQHIDALGAFFSGFPGTGNTYPASPIYPSVTFSVLLSQVTLDTTIPQSTVTGLTDNLSFIRTFIGKDTTASETPTYSAHGDVRFIADGDSLELGVQTVDEAVAKRRPAFDTDFDTDPTKGAGLIVVDNSAGNDVTGDGSVGAPYATIQRAILETPENRISSGNLNVTISLTNTGTAYELPVNITGWNRITLSGELLAAPITGTIQSVTTNSHIEGNYITTQIPYTSDNALAGHLIRMNGKFGQINGSWDNGGNTIIFATEQTAGVAFSTITGGVTTYEIWAPTDLVELNSVGTNANATSINQTDKLDIKLCNITSSATGSNGKLSFYQSRSTLIHCYLGPTWTRLIINNGTLSLNNCYIHTKGETEKFGMITVQGAGILIINGGTCIDGTNSTSGNNIPVTVRQESTVTLSGVCHIRDCDSFSLSSGSSIDYTSGHNQYVGWYFYNYQGDSIFDVQYYDNGDYVSGVIPAVHGDIVPVGKFLLSSSAPTKLFIAENSTISFSGKTAIPVNFGNSHSGEAQEESFVRWDRNRDPATTNGVEYGPWLETVSTASSFSPDALHGPAQKWDLSDAGNDSTTLNLLAFNAGEAGKWVTVEIVVPNTLTFSPSVAYLWAGGSVPTLSQVSGQRDFLRFYFTGSEWIGEVVALNVS